MAGISGFGDTSQGEKQVMFCCVIATRNGKMLGFCSRCTETLGLGVVGKEFAQKLWAKTAESILPWDLPWIFGSTMDFTKSRGEHLGFTMPCKTWHNSPGRKKRLGPKLAPAIQKYVPFPVSAKNHESVAGYPLVNIQTTMEDHHVLWLNQAIINGHVQ